MNKIYTRTRSLLTRSWIPAAFKHDVINDVNFCHIIVINNHMFVLLKQFIWQKQLLDWKLHADVISVNYTFCFCWPILNNYKLQLRTYSYHCRHYHDFRFSRFTITDDLKWLAIWIVLSLHMDITESWYVCSIQFDILGYLLYIS